MHPQMTATVCALSDKEDVRAVLGRDSCMTLILEATAIWVHLGLDTRFKGSLFHWKFMFQQI
jgi:hypothetical protein